MPTERASWDLGRFLKTLAYFRVIPFLGSLDGLGKGDRQKSQQVVLVAGATGGVGKRVVRRLVQKGYAVRSLVRDAQRGKEILGKQADTANFIEADVILPETLTPDVTRDVKAVIWCVGTRVQPVEGDTPTREKYYQGIKFYMPEVVDVPEMVEYNGIKNLVEALKRNTEKTLFDFRQPSEEVKDLWGALDDVVMGGISESSMRLSSDSAMFCGNVSTANSGGFASVRTRNLDPVLNLQEYGGIELRVKGDGKRYKFILRDRAGWDSLSYCYSFDTTADTWTTVRIPFTEFIPVFRAKTVPDAAPLDTSNIASVQLMLSKFEYDRALNPHFSPGSFQLQVASIHAYGGNLPTFVMVSSAGVTRPGRPGLNLEEEPPAVRLNDQLGGILTWKLRGEEVVRQSGFPYTIIRPCALTEEPGGKELVFDQGDNMRGKASRDDIAELCLEALERDRTYNLTFEVRATEEAKGQVNWSERFAALDPDS